MQKRDDFAVGTRFRVAVNERNPGRVEAIQFRLKVGHGIGHVVQPFAALFQKGSNGRIRPGGREEFNFVASDRKKRGHYPFRGHFFALVGPDSEQLRVAKFGRVQVAHGNAEVLDSEPVGRGNHCPKISGTFAGMESIRQKRINSLLQHDMAEVFRALAAAEFPGTLITVSKIRVTPDLGLARVYLSFFPIDRTEKAMEFIQEHAPRIKNELAGRVRHQLRVIPNLQYFADDSMEYEANIERLLREGGENPFK